MVVVKIELWPNGDESLAEPLGRVDIVNNNTGSIQEGNYDVRVKHGGKYFGKSGFYRIGKVTSFRREISPYHLVARALQACGFK